MPSESSILLGTSAANIESSAPNLLRTPGSIGSSSSSSMDGNDCNFVSLEEGAATTTSLSSSSSQSSSTNDVNNNEDDDENHGSILVEVEAPATLAEGYVFWATTTRSNDMDDNTHSCDNNDIPLISTNCIKSITFPVRVVCMHFVLCEDMCCDAMRCEALVWLVFARRAVPWMDGSVLSRFFRICSFFSSRSFAAMTAPRWCFGGRNPEGPHIDTSVGGIFFLRYGGWRFSWKLERRHDERTSRLSREEHNRRRTATAEKQHRH
jgi:hypothetical protein